MNNKHPLHNLLIKKILVVDESSSQSESQPPEKNASPLNLDLFSSSSNSKAKIHKHKHPEKISKSDINSSSSNKRVIKKLANEDYLNSFKQYEYSDGVSESQIQNSQAHFEGIKEKKRKEKRKKNNPHQKSSRFELSKEEKKQIQRFNIQITQKFIDKQMRQKQNILQIYGTSVYFPYQPYNLQVTYMKHVIEALQKGENALLESPTGTGKTLCLLASTLSWIYNQKLAGRHRKIIYLSRTHTQLSQMQKQLKKTCFLPTMTHVGSRDHFCIKKELNDLKGREKIEACSKGVKIKLANLQGKINWKDMKEDQAKQTYNTMCNFYSDRLATIDYGVSHYANKAWQIQDFLQQSKKNEICPYFYPYHMDNYCDFFFMPYNYILFFDLLPRFQQIIEGGVLIFDEAHNVPQAACEGRSYDLNLSNIKGAQTEIQKILLAPKTSQSLKKIRKNWKLRLQELSNYLKNMEMTIFECISRQKLTDEPEAKEKRYYGEDPSQRIKIFNQKTVQLALYEMIMGGILNEGVRDIFLMKGDYFQGQIKKLEKKVSFYCHQIESLIQQLKQTEGGVFQNMEKVANFWTKAINLVSDSFLLKDDFMRNEINHYRLILNITIDKQQQTLDDIPKIKDFAIEFRCLVPWLTFQNIVAMGPRSIIFTSGTMAPLESWERQLNITAPIKLINTHVIKEHQVRLNVLKANLAGKPFDFRFQEMQLNSDEIYQNLIETIFQVSRFVPHGMLVVCPNFKILREIKYLVSQKVNRERMNKVKRQIFEERENENYIAQFKTESQYGAILYCVCRGRASEGIDFPDHHCRAVIFVGVPFPNISDPILIQRKEHFQKLQSFRIKNPKHENVPGINWQKWYFNGTIRAINQSLGRLIRHSKDYGMLFLLDKRYSENRFQTSMPGWAKMGLAIWNQTNQKKIQTIQRFYARNAEYFKPQIQKYQKSNFKIQIKQEQQDEGQRYNKKFSKFYSENSQMSLNISSLKQNESNQQKNIKKYKQTDLSQFFAPKQAKKDHDEENQSINNNSRKNSLGFTKRH